MMRRTPLRRGTKPLRRSTRLRARGNTKYRRRERDFAYMGWVKRQPCILRALPLRDFALTLAARLAGKLLFKRDVILWCWTPCEGPVEADHQGARGMGQKADDRTCVPMCSSHHKQRHAHNGAFKHLTRDELRAWRTEAIARTQAAWEKR